MFGDFGKRQIPRDAYLGYLHTAWIVDLIFFVPLIGTVFIAYCRGSYWMNGYDTKNMEVTTLVNALAEVLPVVPASTAFVYFSYAKNLENTEKRLETKRAPLWRRALGLGPRQQAPQTGTQTPSSSPAPGSSTGAKTDTAPPSKNGDAKKMLGAQALDHRARMKRMGIKGGDRNTRPRARFGGQKGDGSIPELVDGVRGVIGDDLRDARRMRGDDDTPRRPWDGALLGGRYIAGRTLGDGKPQVDGIVGGISEDEFSEKGDKGRFGGIDTPLGVGEPLGVGGDRKFGQTIGPKTREEFEREAGGELYATDTGAQSVGGDAGTGAPIDTGREWHDGKRDDEIGARPSPGIYAGAGVTPQDLSTSFAGVNDAERMRRWKEGLEEKTADHVLGVVREGETTSADRLGLKSVRELESLDAGNVKPLYADTGATLKANAAPFAASENDKPELEKSFEEIRAQSSEPAEPIPHADVGESGGAVTLDPDEVKRAFSQGKSAEEEAAVRLAKKGVQAFEPSISAEDAKLKIMGAEIDTDRLERSMAGADAPPVELPLDLTPRDATITYAQAKSNEEIKKILAGVNPSGWDAFYSADVIKNIDLAQLASATSEDAARKQALRDGILTYKDDAFIENLRLNDNLLQAYGWPERDRLEKINDERLRQGKKILPENPHQITE